MTATDFSSYVYDAAGRITSLTQNLYQPGDADPTHSTIASGNDLDRRLQPSGPHHRLRRPRASARVKAWTN